MRGRGEAFKCCALLALITAMMLVGLTQGSNPLVQTHFVAGEVGSRGAFAYGVLVDSSGKYSGIEPASVMVPDLINSGALYIRVSGGGICPTDPTAISALAQLEAAGLHLGTYLNTFYGGGNNPITSPKPIDSITAQATALWHCGFYDWIFLDAINHRSDAHDVVDAVSAIGWKVQTHYTGWGYSNTTGTYGIYSNPDPDAWSNGAAFFILTQYNKNHDYVTQSPIQWQDVKFWNYVHTAAPNSFPVEYLEGPGEINVFKQQPVAYQESLLTAWANAQAQYGYVMTYPLFIGTSNNPSAPDAYDSITEGTYTLQVSLIKQYNSLNQSSTASMSSSMSSRAVMSTPLTSSTTAVSTILASGTGTVSTPLTSQPIPSFPWESIVLGIMAGLTLVTIMRRRRKEAA